MQHDDLPDVPRLGKASAPPKQKDRLDIQPVTPEQLAKVHLLLPASSGQVNLCKTLLTASVLGYPVPTLISYDQTFKDGVFSQPTYFYTPELTFFFLRRQADRRRAPCRQD